MLAAAAAACDMTPAAATEAALICCLYCCQCLLVLLHSCAQFAGNHCVGSDKGKDAGNGRIVVSVSNGKAGDECGWDVVKVNLTISIIVN